MHPIEPAQACLARARSLLGHRRVAAALAAFAEAHRRGVAAEDTAGERWACHMLLGDFEAAWRISDGVLAAMPPEGFNRRDVPYHRRQVWRGAGFDGRRVLVRCYHGLGDTIQFIRYVPLLRRQARAVTVQAEPRLFGLLRGVAGIDRLVPLSQGREDPEHDLDIEAMELPYAFRAQPAALPAEVPYLARARPPAAGRRLRAGLAWAAGGWDGGRRSVPASFCAPLCRIAGIDWICLQRGEGLARLCPEDGLCFAETPDHSEDLAATASLIAGLDLVISVDTMVAHLSGALAVPTWTLLPHAADWRWMLDRRDSPWYPTMRLFRQPSPGDWRTPIGQIARLLRSGSRT